MPTATSTRFEIAAEAFRGAIDAAQPREPVFTVARRIRGALAEVYYAAIELGVPSFVNEVDDPPDVDRSGSAAIEARLRKCFADDDRFLDVWDPTNPEKGDPIWRTLSAELVEIHEDLGVALAHLANNESTNAAIWDVVQAFESHWGKHAVDVARPLHHLAQ